MTKQLFQAPQLDLEDQRVLTDLEVMRSSLAEHLRVPRRWNGGLRRTAEARAIQGSNSIEGYTVSDDDALAAVDGEEPLTADERTWAEIRGYRRVLTYILRMAPSATFQFDSQLLRTMHYMLLEHDLSKSPGEFRTGTIYVRNSHDDRTVYEGPPAEQVPDLVDALADDLRRDLDLDPIVRAAMAHLNLVMIHPFRDGNGRMSRALQTQVLGQEHVLEPVFSSIEEWLGHNTDLYYRVLALTGEGGWNPGNDTHLWVKFNVRAHHMQAQTVQRRFDQALAIGKQLAELMDKHGLPERVFDPLFDAARGLLVRRPTYVARSGTEDRTASRDLKNLVDAGLLSPRGNTRARFYLAAGPVLELRNEQVHQRAPLDDPYPWLTARLVASR